jgi:hypothetical protein
LKKNFVVKKNHISKGRGLNWCAKEQFFCELVEEFVKKSLPGITPGQTHQNKTKNQLYFFESTLNE